MWWEKKSEQVEPERKRAGGIRGVRPREEGGGGWGGGVNAE